MVLQTYIYGLRHPATGAIRYVGKTIKPLAKRLWQHMNEAKRGGKSRRSVWIRSLLSIGLSPEIFLLEVVGEEWAKAEARWIAQLRTDGHDLVNATDGGEGAVGYTHSDEAKRKIAAVHRGKVNSEASKLLVGEANRGRIPSAETRRRMSASRVGRKMPTRSPEHSEKIAIANRGRKHTAEARANMSAAGKGKPKSAAHLAALAAARSAKKLREVG